MSITLIQRLGSMLLDHAAMTTIAALIGAPSFLLCAFIRRFFNLDLYWVVGIIVFLIYFNKDFFNGKSIAKRVVGLIVMKNDKSETASRLQCFIRNLTIIIWPIEVFISLFSRQRRLGDIIAGTRVEAASKEELSSLLTEIKSLF